MFSYCISRYVSVDYDFYADLLVVCVLVMCLVLVCCSVCFFFQAEDGIRDLVRSRGLGDVYKRQGVGRPAGRGPRGSGRSRPHLRRRAIGPLRGRPQRCLLYTSDAADERSSVDLGGRRIIKKKKTIV